MNRNESNTELDIAAREWAAHFARLGVTHLDEYGRDNGVLYVAPSGNRIRIWAWTFDAHGDEDRGVGARALYEDERQEPLGRTGEAWAYIR